MAIVAMIRMIATTINSSNSEKPRSFFITLLSSVFDRIIISFPRPASVLPVRDARRGPPNCQQSSSEIRVKLMQTGIHPAQALEKLWFGSAFDAKSDKFRQFD
jgi:hypothetical protein